METVQHSAIQNRHPVANGVNQRRAGLLNALRPSGPTARLALVGAFASSIIPTVGAQCTADLGAQCVEQGITSQGLGLFAGAVSWTVISIFSIPGVVWGGVLSVVMGVIGVAWNVLGLGFAVVGLGACAVMAYAAYRGVQEFAAVRAQAAGAHQAVRDDVRAVRDDAVHAFQGAQQFVQNNPVARVAAYTSVAAYTITAGAVALLIVGGLVRTGGVFIAGCIKTTYTFVKNVVLLIVDTIKSVCKIALDIADLFYRVLKFGAGIAYDGFCIAYDGALVLGHSVKSLLTRHVKPAALELTELTELNFKF